VREAAEITAFNVIIRDIRAATRVSVKKEVD
jgi:hypothetical protein